MKNKNPKLNISMLKINKLKINKLKPSTQKAFAIIEALVSTFLFLVGFMGLMAMSIFMIQATNTAKFRAEAVDLVNEITADVLLDKNNQATYADGGSSSTRIKWDTIVKARLPNATTSVTLVGDNMTVTINWKAASEADIHQYQIVTFVSYNN